MSSSILGSKLLQLKYRIEKDLQLDSVWVGWVTGFVGGWPPLWVKNDQFQMWGQMTQVVLYHFSPVKQTGRLLPPQTLEVEMIRQCCHLRQATNPIHCLYIVVLSTRGGLFWAGRMVELSCMKHSSSFHEVCNFTWSHLVSSWMRRGSFPWTTYHHLDRLVRKPIATFSLR